MENQIEAIIMRYSEKYKYSDGTETIEIENLQAIIDEIMQIFSPDKKVRESFISFFSGLSMKNEKNAVKLYCKKYNITRKIVDKELKSLNDEYKKNKIVI